MMATKVLKILNIDVKFSSWYVSICQSTIYNSVNQHWRVFIGRVYLAYGMVYLRITNV